MVLTNDLELRDVVLEFSCNNDKYSNPLCFDNLLTERFADLIEHLVQASEEDPLARQAFAGEYNEEEKEWLQDISNHTCDNLSRA